MVDYTENLSSGGTFILTDKTIPVGEEVKLVLSFPGLLEAIPLQGVVRWTRHGEGQGLGIEFTNFTEDARAQLGHLMAGIASRDPSVVSRTLRILVVEDNPHVARLLRGTEPRVRIGRIGGGAA